jgi:MFS family permease
MNPIPVHQPYEAFQYKNYRFFMLANILSILALQMQTTALGWELYERTHQAIVLAYVGLFQFLPVLCLSLFAGQAADRFDKQTVIRLTQILFTLSALGLMWASYQHASLMWFYGFMVTSAIARSFKTPAASSLLPLLIPEQSIQNAAVWNSSIYQVATIIGPAAAGIGLGMLGHAYWIYGIASLFSVLALVAFLPLRVLYPQVKDRAAIQWQGIAEGFRYLLHNKIILAAMTLDMTAVLFGGVTWLLPIFAKDILHTGPEGLGWLRAAGSIGSLAMAIVLAHLRPIQKNGPILFLVVFLFGLLSIIFGLSKDYWLSFSVLLLAGAIDNISVVIRMSLMQLLPPMHLRGRIASINAIFIGSSNELGGFESGLVASVLGPVFSAISGGVCTIVIVMAGLFLFPELKKLGPLSPQDRETPN